MASEKILYKISTIERGLGTIYGIAIMMEGKYANPILGALETINRALEEIKDGK